MVVTEVHAALGRVLRARRAEMHLSQEEFAGKVGLHRTYVGGIERGERNVSLANLLRLASALDIPLWKLIQQAEANQR